ARATAAALGRCGDLGPGWYGFNLMADEAAARLAPLEALLARRGRKPESVEVSVSPYFKPARDAAALGAYTEAGVDQVIYLVGLRGAEPIRAEVEGLAAELMPAAARLGPGPRRG